MVCLDGYLQSHMKYVAEKGNDIIKKYIGVMCMSFILQSKNNTRALLTGTNQYFRSDFPENLYE